MLTFIDFFAGIGGFRRGMELAGLVNRESQLYKQAGNGVTVPVILAVAERMGKYESDYKVSRKQVEDRRLDHILFP